MNGESSMEIYTLPYVKQTASGDLLYDSRAQVSDNLEEWDGSGREI